MVDPYVYPDSSVLINLANIKDAEILSQMEADYTSSRLSDLVASDSASLFDYNQLCATHYMIFQDLYEWAGKPRTVNMEKEEPALGGLSIEYSDFNNLKTDIEEILKDVNEIDWSGISLEDASVFFAQFMSKLWKIHPFREGNTRTIITFCCQFIESKGRYIDSDLFRANAQYMRTALVAATAIFHDLGDKRKPEYLDNIVADALTLGHQMKNNVISEIQKANIEVTEQLIRKVINLNRSEGDEHDSQEIIRFCKN